MFLLIGMPAILERARGKSQSKSTAKFRDIEQACYDFKDPNPVLCHWLVIWVRFSLYDFNYFIVVCPTCIDD